MMEPACGAGAICKAAKKWSPSIDIEAIDIRDHGWHDTFIADFLDLPPTPEYDLIITNPPYSLALDFIQHAMKFRKDETSVVAMLLRLNFLGSQKRAGWLRDNTPSIFVSPRRPCFKNGRSDATEYAWFVWRDPCPSVKILSTEK